MGISGDYRKLERMIAGLQRLARPATRTELSLRIGQKSLELVDKGFVNGRAPDGSKWKPVLRGGAPLRVTERLRRSIRLVSDYKGFRLASDLIYAGVQNYGATIKAKTAEYLVFRIGNRWSKKKSVTVPARQFLPSPSKLPPEWREAFKVVANKLAKEVLKR